MSTHEFEGQVYFLGTDLLKQRVEETQELIKNLNDEEAHLTERLKTIRRTRAFLTRDYRKLWRRIVKAERLISAHTVHS